MLGIKIGVGILLSIATVLAFAHQKVLVPIPSNKPNKHQQEHIYKKATAQDNILILNVGPDREGKVKETDVKVLLDLRKELGI